MISGRERVNALVVGAGSMGKVITRHLHLAGCGVSFLVRPESTHRLPPELVFYHLNSRNALNNPLRMGTPQVLTDYRSLEDQHWDQVYMCVPSQALRGNLLDQLSRSLGSATIITLQPGLVDGSLFSSHFDDSQIVHMFLSFAAYNAPIDREELPCPGVAYWTPFIPRSLVNGPADRVRDVAATLRRGGLSLRRHHDVDTLLRFTLAFQAPVCAAFVCAGWSFSSGFTGHWLNIAWRGSRQAVAIAERSIGRRPPLMLRHFTRGHIQWVINVLPKLCPFSVESYLAAHYAKLHEQSIYHIDDYISAGRSHGLPVDALVLLRESMEQKPQWKSGR